MTRSNVLLKQLDSIEEGKSYLGTVGKKFSKGGIDFKLHDSVVLYPVDKSEKSFKVSYKGETTIMSELDTRKFISINGTVYG